jgi:hypothetical protein
MALTVSRSRDGGATWDLQSLVTARNGTSTGLDKQWIATDPATGQVYLSYIDTGSSAIEVQRSDDMGATWSAPVVVTQPQDYPPGPAGLIPNQFAQVAVGPHGVVHVVYMAQLFGQHVEALYHRASRDGGRTWDPPKLIADVDMQFDLGVEHKYRSVGMPALALDPGTGDVYVAYPTRDPVDGDIFVSRSFDEGASWQRSRQVNDDSVVGDQGLPTNDQWMAAIAVSADHVVHATWIDYRDDPTAQNAFIYYARSADRGETWSKNAKLSDAPFDGTGGYHQSGSGTIGDYMGLAATPSAVHAIWADTRDHRNDLFTATILGSAPAKP